MTPIVSILGSVIVALVVALIGLVMARLKSQDAKIDTLATAKAADQLKTDFMHLVGQLERRIDNFNERHIEKNHRQDEQIRGIERLEAEFGARIAAIEKRLNGK